MANLLSVAFETDEPEQSETSLDVSLPKGLLEKMKEAAESHLVTDLEGYVDAVDELGPAESRLAVRLRERIRNYDIDGILKVLAETKFKDC